MKLSFAQIKSAAFGALRIENTPDGVRFYRFSEKQGEVYRDDMAAFRLSLATAGVRLEFTTDATSLSLTAIAEEGSSGRRFAYFDVAVDGTPLFHGGEDTFSGNPFTVHTDLPRGEKTVCIYFPPFTAAVVKEVSLSHANTFAPVKKAHRLLSFGDSVTQGFNGFLPSMSYPTLLGDYLDAEVVNNGIGGEVFRPDLVDGDIPYHPDIVTVAYGTNDWRHTEKEVLRMNSAAFYRRVREAFPTAHIFAIIPHMRADAEHLTTKAGTYEEARELVRRAARAQQIPIIEGDTLIPYLYMMRPDSYLLHPDDLGFRFYAERLYHAMLPYLEGAVTPSHNKNSK